MGLKRFLLNKYLIDWDDRISKTKIIITIASSIISTMVILLVIGSLNGFQYIIKNRVHLFYPELGITYYNMPIHDYDAVSQSLRDIDSIRSVEPTIYGEFIIASFNPDQTPRALSGSMVRGIDAKDIIEAFHILRSRGFSLRVYEGDQPGKIPMVLGRELADKMMIDLGDPFRLYIPFFRTTIAGATHKTQDVYLRGIIDTGLFRYNTIAGFMLNNDMQRLLEIDDEVYAIDIYLKSGADIDTVKTEIKNITDGHIRDYTYISKGITGFYELIKKGLYFVLIIILIVGFFNIISMIILMILEKLKEFSILNTLGMPLRSIAFLIALKGFIIGFFSSFTGLALAIIITFLQNRYHLIAIEESVYDISHLPIYLEPVEVIIIMVLIMLLNTIIPMLPSMKILKINPSEILRYE